MHMENVKQSKLLFSHSHAIKLQVKDDLALVKEDPALVKDVLVLVKEDPALVSQNMVKPHKNKA